jgi:hypothetical protein
MYLFIAAMLILLCHFDKNTISYPAKNMFQSNTLVIKIVLRFEDYTKVNNIDNSLNTKDRFFIKFNVFEEKPVMRDDTRQAWINDNDW